MGTRMLLCVVSAAILASGGLAADIVIDLDRNWANAHKDRVLTSTQIKFTKAHKKPKYTFLKKDPSTGQMEPDSGDYDIHIVGTESPNVPAPVGLAFVAELMNTQDHWNGIELIQNAIKAGTTHTVQGVARFWCEHPGKKRKFVQGDPVDAPANTNPDHVFEIHPITRIDGVEFLNAFRPIAPLSPPGPFSRPIPLKAVPFPPKDARTAIKHYDTKKTTVNLTADRVRFTAGTAFYNYVKLKIKRESDPIPIADGVACQVRLFDLNGTSVKNKPVRAVFVAGTAGEAAILSQSQLTVLAMPRVDLSQILALGSTKAGKKVALPWELVVLGVY